MKNISIVHRESGLNSTRLILNAVIDIMESNEPSGIVYVSPEVNMEDVLSLMQDSLAYEVDGEVMMTSSLTAGGAKTFIQAFIS